MTVPAEADAMDRTTAKIGVRNSPDSSCSRVVYVEPWGEDYTLRPGEQLEIIARGGASPPWFHVVESDGVTSVYVEGDGEDFAVWQDGRRIECGHNRGA
jgi:hypothetical protein